MSTLAAQAEVNSVGTPLLDRVFGTLGASLDVWERWQAGKIETVKAKSEIPSTVTPGPSGGAVDRKTIFAIVGAAVGAVLLALLLRPRKKS